MLLVGQVSPLLRSPNIVFFPIGIEARHVTKGLDLNEAAYNDLSVLQQTTLTNYTATGARPFFDDAGADIEDDCNLFDRMPSADTDNDVVRISNFVAGNVYVCID